MSETRPDTRSGKRQSILDAAEALFLSNGLRGTSMEAIARRAGVAKPTLYKHFADKQAVFDALLSRIIGELRRVSEQALDGPGSAAERVAAALAGKYKFLFSYLENSPHAAELYTAPRRDSSGNLASLDRWLKAEIAVAFNAEGRNDGATLAPLLMATAEGISRHVAHAAEIGPAIRFTVRRLSRPD